MSVIIAAGEAISKSPINTSKSKQMFSFPKSLRFPKEDRRNYSDAIYSLPETKSKRSTTFGLGNKYDFTRGQKGINTQFYSNGTDFDKEHPYSPCFTFGAGRDKYEKVYYGTNKMVDKNIPGPGKYYYLKPFGWDAAKFSMKGRNDISKSKASKETSPGPGFYNNIYAINEKGKYPMSNVENIKSFSLINDKLKRFNYKYNNNPGPSDYPQKELMGRIFNSRYRSSEGKSMYGRYKIIDSKLNYPGPGQYVAFSEFGIYESKYAHTEQNSQPKEKEQDSQEEKPKKVSPPKQKKQQKPPEPKKEEPKKEEPKKEEPKTEELKKEKPKTEEPKQEEPKTEEPKKEEPKTEEPKTEEPKQEDNNPNNANPNQEVPKEDNDPNGTNPSQPNVETKAP